LKDASASPEFLVILLKILFVSASGESVRHLAAIQARKQTEQHWHEIDSAHKPDIRSKLLDFTLSDQPKLLLHAAAEIICAIAEADSENEDAWTDLPGKLGRAATSKNAREREMGLYIAYLIMLNAPEVLAPSLQSMLQVLRGALKDPENADVRVNALLTIGEVATNVDSESEDEVEALQQCVPDMVIILRDAVSSGDEDRATKVFETFQQILVLNGAMFSAHFKEIIQFMINVMAGPDVEQEMRLNAIFFLIAAVNARKMKLQASRLGEEIALKALQLVVDLDKFEDDGERNPARQALALLDLLSNQLPPNQVVLPLMKAVGTYSSDSDPKIRRAGILALGMCVEGAPDFFSTQLKDLMPLVLRLLQDDSAIVRAACLKTVARLAEELSEDFGLLHGSLIPTIIDNFDAGEEELLKNPSSASDDVVALVLDSCIAIDALVEGMEKEDTIKYIQDILPRLSRMMQQDNHKLKIVSVAAIGSVAASAEEHFIPYFQGAMQALGAFMQGKETEDELKLRQNTTDSIGKIALAVGAEEFKPYVQPLMQASEEALHLKDADLRESSYILWSQLAKVYKEDFETFIPGVVNGLLECLQQEESFVSDTDFNDIIQKIQKVKDENSGEDISAEIDDILSQSKAAKVLLEKEDDDEMDGDDDGEEEPSTAISMEKEIALEVLGDVLSHTKVTFLPYFEKTIDEVMKQLDHHQPVVRQAAIGTLWRAYATLWQIEVDRYKASGESGTFQLSEVVRKLGSATMAASLALWQEETERYVLSAPLHWNLLYFIVMT
jgi:importin-4